MGISIYGETVLNRTEGFLCLDEIRRFLRWRVTEGDHGFVYNEDNLCIAEWSATACGNVQIVEWA